MRFRISIIRGCLQPCFDGFRCLLVARLVQQGEHIFLVRLHAGLVERVYAEDVTADAAGLLEEVEQRTDGVCVEIPAIDAHAIGSLLYFFEKACGISGYILGVNPFDQPGVEAYKKNMFALLDKPGYEEASKAIKARL